MAEKTHFDAFNPTERGFYVLVQNYGAQRNKAAALYNQLKEAQSSQGGLVPPDLRTAFKAAQGDRDQAALNIVKNIRNCAPHLDRLKVDESTLLRHGSQGELRILCEKYQEQTGPFLRIEYAAQLGAALKDASSMRILKEAKVDLQKLKFEIAYGIAVANGQVSGTEDLDKLYTPIKVYQDSIQDASKLWKMSKTDKTTPAVDVRKAFTARNQNEAALKSNPGASHLYTVLYPHNTRVKAWTRVATQNVSILTGPDAPHRTAAVTETTQKMNELMTAYNDAQTYDDKSFAKYDLRQELRMLREDPQLMTDLKTLNPDMGEQLDKHMGQLFGRERGR